LVSGWHSEKQALAIESIQESEEEEEEEDQYF
jgi:hypothetical protein